MLKFIRKHLKRSFPEALSLAGLVFCILGLVNSPLYAAHKIPVEVNKAKLVALPGGISDVFVANPTIADVQSNAPLGVYVYGKSVGTTSVFITTADGKNTEIIIEVTQGLEQLNTTLKRAFPNDDIQTVSSPNGIVLLGSVASAKTLKDVENVAAQFLGKEGSIVNNLTLSTSTQVYLKVKIAEVSRRVLSKLDTNWGAAVNNLQNHFSYGVLTGKNPLGTAGGFARADALTGNTTGQLGFRFVDRQTDYSTLLDMLDQESLATILAEPNLVALSGEKASFLVGGEFPYPVPQNSQNITIEFKSFGISLEFTPTVLGANLINLQVSPEVSELDLASTTSFNVGGQAVNVPAIKTRKASTSVELSSGQSFAIAGLLSHNVANTIKEFPGLGSIPILGALFRSTDFQRNETELVIIVTPYIINPTMPKNLEIPTTGINHSSTMGMLFSKRLNNKSTARLQTAAGFHTE